MRSNLFLFGEVLWDVLPGDRFVLGGAPLNVAWHLKGLGLDPTVVSRVGRDARGRWILRRMQDWGLGIGGMQLDPRKRTGTVDVTLGDEGPRFQIEPEQSWDFISVEHLPEPDAEEVILYGGTLALRSEPSRESFEALANRPGTSLFVDFNLRPPWTDEEQIQQQLQRARWLKLNRSELGHLTGSAPPEALQDLASEYSLEAVFCTAGEEGALLCSEGKVLTAAPGEPASPQGDSVGAGDAFSAVALTGILLGWDSQLLLERAVAFSAATCNFSGAVTDDEKFYRSFRQEWDLEETHR